LKKLLNISFLNKHGLKISKIAHLSAPEISDKINQFSDDIHNAEGQIESLTMAMIDMDEQYFEQVLSRCILQLGFEETMSRIITPFLIRIGVMWQMGSANPAQEHFITQLIRQKLLVAIDAIIPKDSTRAKRFVFFLPEGELHETSLLFACYLAKKRGHRVLYLGQSVPTADLIAVTEKFSASHLVAFFTSSLHGVDVMNYIHNLSALFEDQRIFVSGRRVLDLCELLPANVIRLNDLEAFLAELEKLA
jgi:methanogenic corrinoid protein MtbC1